uniref:Uncharacterized protein n=1 Tax=Shewanella decolorationis TaxID=256839 RepID=A0A5B8QXI3_9GAMM
MLQQNRNSSLKWAKARDLHLMNSPKLPIYKQLRMHLYGKYSGMNNNLILFIKVFDNEISADT